MTITLQQLNSASPGEALRLLDGLYEHSPWIAEKALAQRPFSSLAALKHAMVTVLANASASLPTLERLIFDVAPETNLKPELANGELWAVEA